MSGIRQQADEPSSRGPRRRTTHFIDEAETDLRTLGLTPRLPRPVRVGLRVGELLAMRASVLSISTGLAAYIYTLGWLQVVFQRKGDSVGIEPQTMETLKTFFQGLSAGWLDPNREFAKVVQVGMLTMLFLLIYIAVSMGPAIYLVRLFVGARVPQLRIQRLYQRQLPVRLACRALHACALAYRAPNLRRPERMKRVSSDLASLTSSLQRMHRGRAGLRLGKYRRAAVKQHAALVVAALRHAEARVDAEGTSALPALGRLLVTVASRYAAGRTAALLDETDLEGMTPARDWEPLRMALSAVLIAGAALWATWMDLPEGADVYVIGGAGILVLVLVYGRRARRALEVFATIRGA
ncbi:hypothetical protein ACF05T_15840 [Streptomyces lateritius]|uniref:Type II secretion system protein GspF domain-containing protein n=1 Tax=Streptomyces lateritius TaxID=67313 RepID=A0ABW6YDD9_9ACTN